MRRIGGGVLKEDAREEGDDPPYTISCREVSHRKSNREVSKCCEKKSEAQTVREEI
mgnify:CR=1 FL=1